jgi:hypothetical protein
VTSVQKIALSLLTTVVIFAAFTMVAFTGLFSTIEARFYEPMKISGIQKQLNAVADSSVTYISTLLSRFGTEKGAYLFNPAIASYLDQTPTDADVQNRTKITGDLFFETPGLDGIRFVDSNGQSIHFSTYTTDVLKQTENLRMYKDYSEAKTAAGDAEIPIETLSAPDSRTNSAAKYIITYDGPNNRIIFSFPFYDRYSAYRGSMLFYVNAIDFNRILIEQNVILLKDTCSLVSSADGHSAGFVFGLPKVSNDLIKTEIVKRWQVNSNGPDKIVIVPDPKESGKNSSYWVLLSSSRSPYVKIAGVFCDSYFTMPAAVQILLLVCVFITVFLVVFMLFSLKHDDMVIIRDRIKRFQLAMINEYVENRENVDWNEVSNQIVKRRQKVSAEIKKSLGHRVKRHEAETEALLNKSWDEIINALNSHAGNALAAPSASLLNDSAEIKKMLEEILSNGGINVPTAAASQPEAAEELEEIPEAEAAEELEEIPEAEPAEELAAEPEPIKNTIDDTVSDLDEFIEQVNSNKETAQNDFEEPLSLGGSVRKQFYPLQEDKSVSDFNAVPFSDFSILDQKDKTEEKKELLQPESSVEVNLEEFGILDENTNPETLREVPEFSSPQNVSVTHISDGSSNNKNSSLNIEPAMPDFAELDDKVTDFDEQPDAQQTEESQISDLSPLSDDEKDSPCLFTPFGANNDSVIDLEPYRADTIIEDENGMYHIADNVVPDGIVQDPEFKKLVDSVLKE